MELTYFLVASILLTLAPGPDILYLLTKSLSDGAKAGIILACGLVSGIVFHTTLVMLGVAAFIKSSATAMLLLKVFGAAYLLFLAFGAFKAAHEGKKIKLARAGGEDTFGGSVQARRLDERPQSEGVAVFLGVPAAVRRLD